MHFIFYKLKEQLFGVLFIFIKWNSTFLKSFSSKKIRYTFRSVIILTNSKIRFWSDFHVTNEQERTCFTKRKCTFSKNINTVFPSKTWSWSKSTGRFQKSTGRLLRFRHILGRSDDEFQNFKISKIREGNVKSFTYFPFLLFQRFLPRHFFLRTVWSWFKVRWITLIQEMILDTKHVPLSTLENFLVAPEVTESLENSL